MSKETEKERSEKLTRSIDFNHIETMRSLVAGDPAIVHSLNQQGTSWLIRAVNFGNLAAVKLFMEHNPDTTVQNEKGETALYMAAKKGRADIIAAILEKDTRALNIVTEKGWSPIMVATVHNHEKAVQELLNHGADLDIKTKSTGGTVFTMAESRGHTHAPILAMLRAAKARQEEKKSGNDVIAQVASLEGEKDQKPSSDLPPPPTIVPSIESREADKRSQFKALSDAVLNNDGDTIRAILTEDPSAPDCDTSGFSLLMLAVDGGGRLQALQALMEYNPDTTTRDWGYGAAGYNVLHYAGRHGQTEIIAAILEKDKRALNQVDDRGWSPIMEVVAQSHLAGHEHLEAVEVFIKHGADLNIQTIGGDTVFTIAKSKGHTHALILRALNEAKARQEAKQSGNDVVAQVASSEEGKDQKPSSDLPLPASQPPIPPQTQIAQVSSDTPMQAAQKGKERG